MTILTISKKQFEKDIGKIDDSMQDKIAMFGTPVEYINNEEIAIEIFPNRPDLLAYQNYKFSFLSFLGKNTGLKKLSVNKPERNYQVIVDKSVNDVRPYTVCAVVKNLKFDDEKIKEIIDIQEKLHLTLGRKRKKAAIGIYPMEKIKLPINYGAKNPKDIKFIPLDETREMDGTQILQRHPTGREYAYLLEGSDKFPFFSDANNEVMSMPPIINSNKTGKISSDTKEIFIECSGFDINILNKILNILCFALAEMGGKIYQTNIKYSTKTLVSPDLEPLKMRLSLKNTNKLLGLKLKENEVKKLLEKMGYSYSNGKVLVPPYRSDVLHEVDLIEDIAIAYGYDNFIPAIPEISTTGKINSGEIFKEKISEILLGLGLLETSSYHLTTKEFQLIKMNKKQEVIEVKDSKTEYSILRNDLSHYLLKIFYENPDVEYPQDIFQLGKVFVINGDDIKEEERLAIGLAPGNFTRLKQIIDYLGNNIGKEFSFGVPNDFPEQFVEGRVAEVKLNGKPLGYFGEVHPKILKNFKIKMPVALLEINLEELFNTIQNNS
ncbi:phenylalanine--tRNA ligase subunit beta [Candidatus Pacearchaeota archaeon CG10_big_fil_rev_8_21_14_0_10_31_9]|nr:MAG: phenylalanine--tRNA ligase subunit beta [Candidatus Pacearchaeota archaeon CG10_big_fil_rev_8_21_14_0_10_31_9]